MSHASYFTCLLKLRSLGKRRIVDVLFKVNYGEQRLKPGEEWLLY